MLPSRFAAFSFRPPSIDSSSPLPALRTSTLPPLPLKSARFALRLCAVMGDCARAAGAHSELAANALPAPADH
jgi:hypothetical protein